MEKKIELFVGGCTDINISENYYETAKILGKYINARDYHILFDGCNGLPYITFKQIEDYNKTTVFYSSYQNRPSIDICERSKWLHNFKHQSEVTEAFLKNSDAMIFMKGNMGTISEIVTAIDRKKNHQYFNPIVILNINNEWNELVTLLNSYNLNHLFYVTDNVIDALNYIESELFKENSYFRKLWIDTNFFKRKEPIIITDNITTKKL